MKKILFSLFFIITLGSINSNAEIKPIIDGNKDAKIKLMVYESLTCSHCANFHKNVYPKLKKDFLDKGLALIEYKNFPLDMAAFNASKIAHCKNDGNSEILHYLFENQEQWIKGKSIDDLNQNIKTLIEKSNFNLDFKKCLNDKLVEELSNIELPNKFGEFQLRLFEDTVHGDHHVALVKGDISKEDEILVRVHSQCLTGDIFGSLRCDCGEQLDGALDRIEKEGKGVLVYLRQEGRGIGLKNKIMAYKLQEEGLDTVEANHRLGFPADLREYGIGAQILRECGVRKMRLLTNNPRKIIGLDGYGLEIIGRENIEIKSNVVNKGYLKTKRDKLGHFILNEE